MLPADSFFFAAVIVIIVANLHYGPRIASDRIAIHWGFDGKPNGYARKSFALWGMLALLFAVRLVIWAAMTYAPQHTHGVSFGIIGSSIIIAASHLFVLSQAAKSDRAT